MGLETEKVDTRIFMDDDNFPRSGSPALSEAEKGAEDELNRDPRGMNAHLQLGFEDVIAEPQLTHSFDKVWICSHALFELSKYVIYKLLTLVLAIPLALVVGVVFAALSCLHICLDAIFNRFFFPMLHYVVTLLVSILQSMLISLAYANFYCSTSLKQAVTISMNASADWSKLTALVVVPFVKTCLMVLPSMQTIWKSLTDVFIVPFFQSIGRCFAMVNIRLDQE